MIKSKLTRKAQTTIPSSVRSALRLEAGDEIVYEIVEAGRVALTKSPSGSIEDPFGTFLEWEGDADRQAYADL